MTCIHNINLNTHCEDCFKESKGTNQRGIAHVKNPLIDPLLTIKDFLEWGAKTGSDRELFDDRFRKILKNAKIEFTEPE